jgi:hypothetical protein
MNSLTVIAFRHKETDEEQELFLERMKNQDFKDFNIVIMHEKKDVKEYNIVSIEDNLVIVEGPYHGDWGQTSKYNATIAYANSEFVCFPNVDSYYEPSFLSECYYTAKEYDAILVYTDMDTPSFFNTRPIVCGIDVGGFIVRRDLVKDDGWTDRSNLGDGRLVERISSKGCVRKISKVLYHKR